LAATGFFVYFFELQQKSKIRLIKIQIHCEVKGEFREGHIGFSGEAPFFLHRQSYERKIS